MIVGVNFASCTRCGGTGWIRGAVTNDSPPSDQSVCEASGPHCSAVEDAESGASLRDVVVRVENHRQLIGPDYALVFLINGKVLEVGVGGVNVYESKKHFESGELAKQWINFHSETESRLQLSSNDKMRSGHE